MSKGSWSIEPFVYGGVASMFAESVTFPIDTTKTRLQVQGQQLGGHGIRYRGMFHAMRTIYSQEGLAALYNGIRPSLFRQATYGTLKMGIYKLLKNSMVKNEKDASLTISIMCGVLAGVISGAVANPTDVLKVRLQANSLATQKSTSVSLWRAFHKIYLDEGWRGLYRGVIPTAQRAAIIAGVELSVYDSIKQKIMSANIMEDNSRYVHFISSIAAGLFSALASNPVDVIRTRLMNQRKMRFSESVDAANQIYSSATDCLRRTVRHEGVLALWRGFLPNWLRLGPWCIVFFMTYEQLNLWGTLLLH